VSREHQYRVGVEWTGNQGSGTSNYRAFSRNHTVSAEHKPDLLGSSDPAFRGDATRWTPEDLLVAAVSQCHMLWYLHLCAVAGIVVTAYRDDPIGVMVEDDEAAGGGGQFVGLTLRPTVTVRDPEMVLPAEALHGDVGAHCFIARSLNFPVAHQPRVSAVPGR
jgi:organic hydroperoxide reductase OsmC/OhrA